MTLLDCWPIPERVEETFAADVHSLADETLRLVKQPILLRNGETLLTDEELLQRLRADLRICLIQGRKGSGKSLLLRWLANELSAQGLSAVRVEGPSSSDVLNLATTGSSEQKHEVVSKEQLCQRLIDQLQKESQEAQARIAQAKQEEIAPNSHDRDVAGWLAKGLGDLFSDPITREQFLLDEKGIIAVLAEQISTGANRSRFSESDFLRPDNLRFAEASRPAQMMVTKLTLASMNQFRIAAAELMNRVVDAAAPFSEIVPATQRILVIDDALATEDTGWHDVLDRLQADPATRIVMTVEDTCSWAGLDVECWQIVDPTMDDADFIFDMTAAYLDVARRPLSDMSPNEHCDIEAYGRACNGLPLFPFKQDQLLTFLFNEGETRITAGQIVARLRTRLLEGREEFARSLAPVIRVPDPFVEHPQSEQPAFSMEVSDFIAALDKGSAPISLLTVEVLQWIKETNQLETLRVVRQPIPVDDSAPR